MGPNPNGPRFVSCNRVIRYSALGVLSVVLLEIFWISFPNNFPNNPPTLQVARISNPISEPRQVQLLLLQEFLLKKNKIPTPFSTKRSEAWKPRDVSSQVGNQAFQIPSGKLRLAGWNIPIFHRKYIFQGSILHCYLSLPECIFKGENPQLLVH